MTSHLRIMDIGDDPRDAEIITSALEEDGIVCNVFRADSLEEFSNAVDQGGFDILFTDYSLPGFDGLTARALTKEKSAKYTVYIHFKDKERSAES
jgi:two-component system cell cycle sensor histidine kinase/response regulator CckA